MKHQFETVVRAFCAAENYPQPERLIDGESMALHGVEFSLLYEEDSAVDALYLRIVFGNAPLNNETAIYRVLLNNNHANYCGNGPGFCVSPASGRVVYLLKMPLSDASPARLMRTMLYFTDRVKEWQGTYFLTSVARRDTHFPDVSAIVLAGIVAAGNGLPGKDIAGWSGGEAEG